MFYLLNMKFKNPSNDYVETTTAWAFLWIFILGPIYFLVKGNYRHAIAGLVIGIITFGLSWFIYPFFWKSISKNFYLKKGWVEIQE